MNPTNIQPQEPREQLRHRFLAHAAAAFDLLFLPEDPNHLLSFTQREQRAAELSRDYGAAQAAQGKGTEAAWQCYERWLRWAWSGRVRALQAELRAASARCGQPPPACAEEDPRKALAEAVSYVSNNEKRMDYPHERRLGLPISSAAVESTIKPLNRRVKGSEKFWGSGGAEAMLQLRAA